MPGNLQPIIIIDVQSLLIGHTVYEILYRIYLTKERHVLCSLCCNHFKLRIAVSKQFITSSCMLFYRTRVFTLLAVEVEFLRQSHQVLHTLQLNCVGSGVSVKVWSWTIVCAVHVGVDLSANATGVALKFTNIILDAIPRLVAGVIRTIIMRAGRDQFLQSPTGELEVCTNCKI